ncbi:hypothetical protein B0H13DRAFT_2276242 [Mycena leptocephala]|nr:hypothetical protein B0H13DRAFT_2276242 [Mycena leptocephala]
MHPHRARDMDKKPWASASPNLWEISICQTRLSDKLLFAPFTNVSTINYVSALRGTPPSPRKDLEPRLDFYRLDVNEVHRGLLPSEDEEPLDLEFEKLCAPPPPPVSLHPPADKDKKKPSAPSSSSSTTRKPYRFWLIAAHLPPGATEEKEKYTYKDDRITKEHIDGLLSAGTKLWERVGRISTDVADFIPAVHMQISEFHDVRSGVSDDTIGGPSPSFTSIVDTLALAAGAPAPSDDDAARNTRPHTEIPQTAALGTTFVYTRAVAAAYGTASIYSSGRGHVVPPRQYKMARAWFRMAVFPPPFPSSDLPPVINSQSDISTLWSTASAGLKDCPQMSGCFLWRRERNVSSHSRVSKLIPISVETSDMFMLF